LEEPLKLLAQAVGPDRDEVLEGVTTACRRVKSWAAGQNLLAVQREFAHVIARINPDDLAAALEAARLTRDAGDHPRGERWFRYVIARARKVDDWKSYAWAYIGLGVLYHRAGNHPGAVVVLHRARRAAYRHGLMPEAGSAHHHLFTLAAESGRVADVYTHVEMALRCYGRESERLPSLVHDAGRFWIDVGQYRRALPVLEAVCPLLEPHVNEYTLCRANLAWAAAGAGDLGKFEAYEEATVAAVRKRPREEVAAQAYLHLGYALELLRDTESARELAERARLLSEGVGAVYVRMKSEELLERLAGAEAPQQPDRAASAESPQITRRAQQLARELAGAVGEGPW
jgi:tetratricopeptide (TPR) repeat protein